MSCDVGEVTESLENELLSQYYMPSQHIYRGRVWNLIQACDVQSSD